jgi:predicted ribosome quality control (RQC) complex YloA/Tae2 family protein
VLSLRELRRVAGRLERLLAGARLVRSLERGRHELVLVFETGGRDAPRARHALLLSCRARLERLSLLAEVPSAPPRPGTLAQFLRAHLQGGRLENVRVAPGDRLVRLEVVTREGPWQLLLALMGGRSNVYVLDAEDRVRLALRPLERTRRDLALGEVWQDPTPPREAGEGEDRFADVADEALFAAIEEAARERERGEEGDERVAHLRRLLRRRRHTLERKREHLEQDLGAGERAARLERAGELLKTQLHRVERGATEIEARDPASGEEVTIPLDPSLAPGANVEALFRRYRKELRRAARAGDELASVRRGLDRVRELETRLEAAGPEDVDALAREPELERLLARARPPEPRPRRRPSDVPARLRPRRYRSRTGLEIWVGRSDEGNDHLTTRLARGNDLFLHLEGQPGSHVVLRTEGRPDPPAEALLEACELAVHFSKQRGTSRASVHVVPIKQVRKPKGAKPGLVMVHGGRTVALRHDPARLRRILEGLVPEAE